MTIDKLADTFHKLCVAKTYAIDSNTPEYKLLTKIDNSSHHYLESSKLTDDELILAYRLEGKGWIDLIPAGQTTTQEVVRDQRGRIIRYLPRKHEPVSRPLPERWVLTAAGNYMLGIFDFDNL